MSDQKQTAGIAMADDPAPLIWCIRAEWSGQTRRGEKTCYVSAIDAAEAHRRVADKVRRIGRRRHIRLIQIGQPVPPQEASNA